jgi:hypothetical protein
MPAPFLVSNPSSLVSTGPGAPVMNTGHPLMPVSNPLGLNGIHTTPFEVGQLSGEESTRERPASVRCDNRHSVLPRQKICPPCRSNTVAAHGSSDGTTPSLLLMLVDTCTIRLPQVQQRREQTHSGSFLDRSGYDTDQPSPSAVRARSGLSSVSNAAQCSSSSDCKMSSQLQSPPAPLESSQRTIKWFRFSKIGLWRIPSGTNFLETACTYCRILDAVLPMSCRVCFVGFFF